MAALPARPRLHAILPAAALAAVLAAVAVCTAPALGGDFAFDDRTSVATNRRVHDLASFAAGFDLRDGLSSRPLTDLTYAVDAERGRLHPRAFHETNLALHLATVLLVFAFTRALLRRAGMGDAATWSAVAVSALFGLHPIQSQAVCYVSQRAEILAAVLGLAALLLFLAAERASRARRVVALGVAGLACQLLALAAKVIAIAVPALYLLVILWFPHAAEESAVGDAGAARSAWRRRAALLGASLALSLAQAIAFLRSMGGSQEVGFQIPGLDPWHYLLTQARVVPLYLRLLAWPSGLNIDHDVRPSVGLLDPATTLAGALFLLALSGAAVAVLVVSRRRPSDGPAARAASVASFGVAWFFVALAPTSSLLPLSDVVMEHRVYLASWGFFVAAAVGLATIAGRLPTGRRWILVGVPVVVAVALGALLHARATLWGDPISLWRDAAAKSPLRSRPHLNIAYDLQKRGDLESALASYRRALALGVGSEEPKVLENVATALLDLHRPAEARATLATIRSPEPLVVVLLAQAALDLGDVEIAGKYAWELVLRASGYDRSHEMMGKVREAQGDLAGARDAYRRATAILPEARTLRRLARVEAALGDPAAACRTLARAAAQVADPWGARWAAIEAKKAGCR